MDELEYLVIKALGPDNVVKAIFEKSNESPQWRLTHIVPSGLEPHKHPLDPGRGIAIMTFLVVFERPHIPPGVGRA